MQPIIPSNGADVGPFPIYPDSPLKLPSSGHSVMVVAKIADAVAEAVGDAVIPCETLVAEGVTLGIFDEVGDWLTTGTALGDVVPEESGLRSHLLHLGVRLCACAIFAK